MAMGKYVLAKYHPEMQGHVFICGGPLAPTFDPDVSKAATFDSIDDALLLRSGLPHLLGGTDAYHVHEVLPDGRVVDVEP
jgi:hypothetical protein